MMPQFKTLQFPNTPAGQAEKNRTLEREVAQGWRVVSETIVPGKFKGGTACCLFLICTPCAFLAGHEDDTISVTLQRDDPDEPAQGPQYDKAKWSALLLYDDAVAAAAEMVKPYGVHWVSELAAAYLALNDPHYLPQIVERIVARARDEQAEQKRMEVEREERRRSDEAAARLAEERRRQLRQEEWAVWRHRLWGTPARRVVTIIVTLLILSVVGHAIALVGENQPKPSPNSSSTALEPPAPVNGQSLSANLPAASEQHVLPDPAMRRSAEDASPSFDCGNVHSRVLVLVCATPELAQLDREMSKAYAAALVRALDPGRLKQDQRAWIRDRNNSVDDGEILRSMYSDRIEYLNAVGSSGEPVDQ